MKKSNDTYGWMQDLKDLAEAERSLEIIPYVSIFFERKKKGSYDGQVLYAYDNFNQCYELSLSFTNDSDKE